MGTYTINGLKYNGLEEFLDSDEVKANVEAEADFLRMAQRNYKQYYIENPDLVGGFGGLYDYYIDSGAIECPRQVYNQVAHLLFDRNETLYMREDTDYENASWWLLTRTPKEKLVNNIYGEYNQNVIVPSEVDIDDDSLLLLAGSKGRVYRLEDENTEAKIIMKDAKKTFLLYGKDIDRTVVDESATKYKLS